MDATLVVRLTRPTQGYLQPATDWLRQTQPVGVDIAVASCRRGQFPRFHLTTTTTTTPREAGTDARQRRSCRQRTSARATQPLAARRRLD